MRHVGETLDEWIERDPGGVLAEIIHAKAFLLAAETSLKKRMIEKGEKKIVTTNGKATMRHIKKKLKSLNASKSAAILEEAGYDVLALGEYRLTESSIKAALGVTEGAKVIKILKDAGCYNTREIEYFGIKT